MMRKVTFLLGTGRCGSTLVQRVLNSSPKAIIWGEHAGFLRSIAQGYFQVLTNENIERLVYQKTDLYSPQKIIDNREQICQQDISWMNNFTKNSIRKNHINFIESIFCKQLPSSITNWGFKEILYGMNDRDRSLDMLLELFPESRNIIITRHPCNTLVSMLSAWHPYLIDDFNKNEDNKQLQARLHQLVRSRAEKWSNQNQILLGYYEKYPQNFVLIKYEDLQNQLVNDVFPFIELNIPENLESIFERNVWATKGSDRGVVSKKVLNSQMDEIQKIVGSIAKELDYDITS